jgi:hypothetical protein
LPGLNTAKNVQKKKQNANAIVVEVSLPQNAYKEVKQQ